MSSHNKQNGSLAANTNGLNSSAPTSNAAITPSPVSETAALSPNHPRNLRKLATVDLTDDYTIKSYVGAANALRDKAQAADLQGQLEQAFVNYLKAAQIVLFIPKHKEWQAVAQRRSPIYYRYQDITQRTPDMIARAKRIEEQLIQREERRTREAVAEAAARQASSDGQGLQDDTRPRLQAREGIECGEEQALYELDGHLEALSVSDAQIEDALKEWGKSSNTAASASSSDVAARQTDLSGPRASSSSSASATSSGDSHVHSFAREGNITTSLHGPGAMHPRSGTPDLSTEDVNARTDEAVNSLEARLQALRGGASASDTAVGGSASSASGAAHRFGQGGQPGSTDSYNSITGRRLDHSAASATGGRLRSGWEPQELEIPHDVRHYYEDEGGEPTPRDDGSEAFDQQYPSLDEFEREIGSTRDTGTGSGIGGSGRQPTNGYHHAAFAEEGEEGEAAGRPIFPTAPDHQPGFKRDMRSSLGEPPSRPVGSFPPAPPTELMQNGAARTVAGAVAGEDPLRPSTAPNASSTAAQSISMTSAARARPLIPAGSKPSSKAGPSAMCASTSTTSSSNSMTHPAPPLPPPAPPSAPGAGDGSYGVKPQPPLSNHVKAHELWQLLNPGFASVRDQATGREIILKRKGLRVLLLDLRPKEHYQKGRIKAEHIVNVEPLMLKPGMTSDEIENKLILSTQAEQQDFANRHTFDLVILYDQNSRSLGPVPIQAASGKLNSSDEARERLDIVVKAIYEREFRKNLRHQPTLLVGGFESWIRAVREDGAVGIGEPSGETAVNGGAVKLRSPSQPPQESDRVSWRQGAVLPDEMDTPHTTHSVYQFHLTANGASSLTPLPPAAAFVAPSLPARAYQAGTPVGMDGFAVLPAPYAPGFVASSSQPHIPYGAPQPSRKTSFDYPQLRSQQSSDTPTPPPAAAGSSTRATHGRTDSSTSIPHATRLQESLHRPPLAVKHTNSLFTSSQVARVRIGLTGLKNVGNSCYMNSTLQCLSATPKFARFFLDGSYKKAINETNPLGTKGVLAEAFAGLIRVLWSEHYTFVSPVTFRQAITRFAPAFRGYDQHDSQEFLAFLLDGLHEDLNYVIHKPPPVEMTPQREAELETLPQQIASVKEWAIYRQRNDSLIVDFFQGQFRNKMTCLTCGKTSATYNAFMYLSLPIPSGRGISKVTLQQCLDAFVREEIMDKADAWNCPQCKKPRKATKRLSISRLPHFLLIHLKRFSFRGPYTDKIETRVTFPTSALDLTNYMPPPLPPGAIMKGVPVSVSQQPPYMYDLFAVTHHFGTLSSGHYTATIRNNGQWDYCDDSRIVRNDERQLHTNSPYVLWFQRRPN